MARFGFEDYDNYGNNSNSTRFFSLKNDRDTARVRFMYNDMEDIFAYAVHQITVGENKKRYVNCIRTYRDKMSRCPFCREGVKSTVRMFVPVYNIDTGTVQIWERGKRFFTELQAQCRRYANADTPLCANVFEIERNGRAGSKETTYGIYKIDTDNTKLSDLPEIPDPIGTIILDKTADEMEYWLDYGEFAENDNTPVHRNAEQSRQDDNARVGRRTAVRSQNREDRDF